MSAELQGLGEFQSKAAAAAADVEKRARGVAQATSTRVAAGIRSRVRRALQGRLSAAVAVAEEAGAKQFVVGFDDGKLLSAGLFPMVPVWHEFGTKFKESNPAVGDALAAERQRYLNEMREAVTQSLQEASR